MEQINPSLELRWLSRSRQTSQGMGLDTVHYHFAMPAALCPMLRNPNANPQSGHSEFAGRQTRQRGCENYWYLPVMGVIRLSEAEKQRPPAQPGLIAACRLVGERRHG